MSAVKASGDQTESKEKTGVQQASEAGASAKAPAQVSLEDQIRLLHKQINSSDWLQKNTADDWANANPEAAAELKKIIAEKRAAQNPPQ